GVGLFHAHPEIRHQRPPGTASTTSATPPAVRRHVAEPCRRLVRRLADALDETLEAVASEALRRAGDAHGGHAIAVAIEQRHGDRRHVGPPLTATAPHAGSPELVEPGPERALLRDRQRRLLLHAGVEHAIEQMAALEGE